MLSNEKPVLITGCSSGIGYCVARGLHEKGYRVFASARNTEDVSRLELEGLRTLQLDLTSPESIENALNQLLKETDGVLYGLFNNGAYGQAGAVEDLSRDVMRKQLETNLLGWLDLTNRVIPVMRKQGYGRIIQNSSVLGLVSLPFRGAYNCSKHALEGLTHTLRLELSGTGIKVSLIEPGPIESRFRQNSLQALLNNINIDASVHRDKYRKAISRLQREENVAPFTLPPEAVLKKVIHALESPRPKPRYYVTFPTYLLGTLNRILTVGMMDRVLLRISRSEME